MGEERGVDEACLALKGEPLPELALGANEVVEAIISRIERHFAAIDGCGKGGNGKGAPPCEEPLVVGIFGEWGAGKTLWLRSVENHFRERLVEQLIASFQNGDLPEVITIPVFFNAWRYEKEEHLVYPLIKTLEREISHLMDDCVASINEAADERGHSLKKVVDSLKHGLGRAWSSSLKLASAISTGMLAMGSGITLSGKLRSNNPVLKSVFDGEVNIEISGKNITDFLFAASGAKSKDGEEKSKKIKEELESREQDQKEAGSVQEFLRLAEQIHSYYYDFHRILRELTGRKPGVKGLKFNLLFLIDDLDRCLPEKAVEMLEAIKLFLEVEGTAFVLALDDEVVERGIAHRYRDYMETNHPTAWDSIAHSLDPDRYREFLDLYAVNREQPITGHEYLEKIVHLQVRIPRAQEVDAEAFLLARYSQLFKEKVGEPARAEERGGGKSGTQPHDQKGDGVDSAREPFDRIKVRFHGQENVDQRQENGGRVRVDLLRLFVKAVPGVPRKLIRAAELLNLKVETAKKNGWDPTQDDRDLYILAQLAIIQSFAPELYRFALKNGFWTFLMRLEELLDEGREPPPNYCLAELGREYREILGATQKKAGGENAGSLRCRRPQIPSSPYLIERLELPFIDLLVRTRRQRSGFDPFNVVRYGPTQQNKRAVSFGKFFFLRGVAQKTVIRQRVGRKLTANSEEYVNVPRYKRSQIQRELQEAQKEDQEFVFEPSILMPENPRDFVEQITTSEPSYWLNALQDPGVRGKRGKLDPEVFEQIQEKLQKQGGFFEDQPDRLLEWLELLEPIVSQEQFDELVRASRAFEVVLGKG